MCLSREFNLNFLQSVFTLCAVLMLKKKKANCLCSLVRTELKASYNDVIVDGVNNHLA